MKVTFKADLNAAARKASQQAAKASFQILNARFQAALATPAFDWSPVLANPKEGQSAGVTVRSNGQVVSSPRNIIDTGNLRRTNTGPEINGLRARFRWTAPYAAAVHEGAVLLNGTVLPARPWTSAVLGTEPISGIPVFDRETFRTVWLQAYKAST